MKCAICRRDNPPDSNFCRVCGRPLHAARAAEPESIHPVEAVVEVQKGEAYRVLPAVSVRKAAVPKEVRRGGQSPLFALFVGLLIPGAGQAYNGQPVKAFFLFFASVLIIPFLYSLINAYSTAKRIRADGLSTGSSGFMWLFMQGWLAANAAVLTVVGLTIGGVLK